MEETSICVVDENGTVIKEGKAPTDPDPVMQWLLLLDLKFERVGLEAGPLSPWLHDGLRACGYPAVCIETRRMKGATAAMAMKTDRNDARAIAHAMRVGWFTAVHVKSQASQELRLLLTNRRTLLQQRVGLENEIRGTLKAFGIKVGVVSKGGFEVRVRELLADRPRLLAMIEPMLAVRDTLRRQYLTLHRMVMAAVLRSPVCRRLMTVPGVGPIVALTYATGVDDPSRFRRSRDVGPHFGLVPRKYASGEIDHNLSISKSGDTLVREALFQAAQVLMWRVGRWSALKAWGMQIAKRRGMRRATVAVARKLGVIMHRIWVDDVDFRWSREAAVA